AFLKQADTNADGKISSTEFDALASKWFAQWDTEKTGKLNQSQLRAGLNSTLAGGGGARMAGIRLQGNEGQRNGLASAMGVEFNFVHADLEFEGKVLKDVGIRYKGNGTWMQSGGTDKHSFKIDLNHFNKDEKFAGIT